MCFKPRKPEILGGCRNALTVNIWLYYADKNFNAMQVVSPQIVIDANTKVAFTNILLKGAAAFRWYIPVKSDRPPGAWVHGMRSRPQGRTSLFCKKA